MAAPLLTCVAGRWTFAGLFLVTLATLMYEVLLTRIFSVTMWYHFAFVAISVALFGMTAGAIIVYLYPGAFSRGRTHHRLALMALLFSLAVVFSFLSHLSIPFVPKTLTSLVGVYSLALTYVIVSVPFVFSGICICLAMTRFPDQVSRLYAVDLAGAALGCILLICTLRVTDGATAVFLVALLAALGALLFAVAARSRRVIAGAAIAGVLLAGFVVANTVMAHRQRQLIRLTWVKGEREDTPLVEKWNSFSRVTVSGDPDRPKRPFGWGLSSTIPDDFRVAEMWLEIDGSAGTPLTAFSGDFRKVDHLRYDVTNIAHYLRRDANVLVVGSGGGRDILSALLFDQKSVVGVEINEDIIEVVTNTFGDFTGHLDRDPRVRFVNEEARSYIASSEDKYDILQVSLIDTWAATASGAFVLSESSLYTVEAWTSFLEHLSPQGILTFSRWHFRDMPGELYRVTSLATAALLRTGVTEPRKHIIIVKRSTHRLGTGKDSPDGVGTILVSPEPFGKADLETVKRVAAEMKFELTLTPEVAEDETFSAIASGEDLAKVAADFPIDISPPTDDRPFFFHMLRLRDMFNTKLWRQGAMSFNMRAVFVLGALLAIVLVLTLLCIIVPLALTTKREMLAGSLPHFVFFTAIGLGFMFVEISQMQRLIVFLGHPTYGLSVLLFAILLSSGIGSFTTRRAADSSPSASRWRLLALLCVLALFGVLTPFAIRAFQGATTPARIAVATAIILPLGFFMGMPFPLGMTVASRETPQVTPWLWGTNGATSVCASVLAVVIALTWSISTSFWCGVVCYAVAFLAYLRTSRKH